MPIRLLLAAAAAAALAACGGAPQPSRSSETAARKAMLDFAACMRKHGVPMQDPTFTQNGGGVTFGSTGHIDPHTQRAAQQACGHYMKHAGHGKLPSAAEQAAFRKLALAQSRCMRAHGITNFPDPKFGANGEASLEIDKRSGLDPHDPAFQRAQQACAKYMPGRKVVGQ